MTQLASIQTRALDGMTAPAVIVEAHMANGLPSFTLVGLAETEVREARDRVRAAILSNGYEWPARRIVVNLAPADLPKESGRFDLPIALAVLAASGQIPQERMGQYCFAGELSLSGELRPIRGALAMAAALRDAKLILPASSASEAAWVRGLEVFAANTLGQVCDFLCGRVDLPLAKALEVAVKLEACYPDMADVKGQSQAKRALEIAAAGGHGVLMVGPPGTGKSMLAQRFAGLLPAMTEAEALESAAVLSVTNLFDQKQFGKRTFRAPHHTASGVALVGGGSVPRPGEISLAHHGVLFLDELPEFSRSVLDVLREPMETGTISISRAARRADYPARFQLIAAMNPCPCGYLGHPSRPCRCTLDQVGRYQSRVSGPLLDRIDVQITVPPLNHDELLADHTKIDPNAGPKKSIPTEASQQIAARVLAARDIMLQRQQCTNALLSGANLTLHCATDEAGTNLLKAAIAKLGWSARATHRVLRLARTIADLAGVAAVSAAHIAEAIQYRRGLQAGV